jgi:hypothetical protein
MRLGASFTGKKFTLMFTEIKNDEAEETPTCQGIVIDFMNIRGLHFDWQNHTITLQLYSPPRFISTLQKTKDSSLELDLYLINW